jgi:hypothetical protein
MANEVGRFSASVEQGVNNCKLAVRTEIGAARPRRIPPITKKVRSQCAITSTEAVNYRRPSGTRSGAAVQEDHRRTRTVIKVEMTAAVCRF